MTSGEDHKKRHSADYEGPLDFECAAVIEDTVSNDPTNCVIAVISVSQDELYIVGSAFARLFSDHVLDLLSDGLDLLLIGFSSISDQSVLRPVLSAIRAASL